QDRDANTDAERVKDLKILDLDAADKWVEEGINKIGHHLPEHSEASLLQLRRDLRRLRRETHDRLILEAKSQKVMMNFFPSIPRKKGDDTVMEIETQNE
ncbi:hypothetical protein SARC_17278, partial [Sphaeroforma arctica JP610]